VIGARTRGSAVVIGASSGTEATVCMIGMLRGAAPVGTARGHATGKGVPIKCLRNAQRPSRLDLQVSTRIQYSSGTRFIITLDELARVGDRPAVVPSGRRASTGSPSPTTPAVRSASSRPSTWPPPRYAIPGHPFRHRVGLHRRRARRGVLAHPATAVELQDDQVPAAHIGILLRRRHRRPSRTALCSGTDRRPQKPL
jgi:hypothetical protein